MSIKIALAGNPNCGKTTMFNALTGSTQFVGNWPGVTVEKKEGKYKKNKDIQIVDLPGIYSLSPYTLEEVVARNFLISENPDVIVNIIDGTNLERNLYLTTQLLELGIPVVIALNMMDIVNKNNDAINTTRLSAELGCPVVEASALKGKGLDKVMQEAVSILKPPAYVRFSKTVEDALIKIEKFLPMELDSTKKRWYAVKLFERDEKIEGSTPEIEAIVSEVEEKLDDDTQSIIINERYTYITKIIKGCYNKRTKGLTISDKIDGIVTNRILGLPIFAVVMFLVYYISVTSVGTLVTDFTNDMLVGEWIQAPMGVWLESIGTAGWLTGLIVDGIIGGVGAVVGFLPQMLILFFFLALLEDCGYMARIAFLMDRIFRRFGMSGKSFIPLLIGTGCGLPGIMASRTIEQETDRKMTIMTVTFMPCGAKLPIIALIAGALLGNVWWVAPSAYFIGIGAVMVTGIILKKTKLFAGEPAPFVMELPAYHIPTVSNIAHSMYERGSSFVKKAVTVYMLASILVWFGLSFGFTDGNFGLVDNLTDSVLHSIGNSLAWIFAPLGFGQWQAVVASIMGLVAKEEIVGVFGVLTSIGDADLAYELVDAAATTELAPIAALFTSALAAYSFLVFNLLCAPCIAAMNTIRSEMRSWKWTLFAIGYQCLFAYMATFLIYQIGLLFIGGEFSAVTLIAFAILALITFMVLRPESKKVLYYKKELSRV